MGWINHPLLVSPTGASPAPVVPEVIGEWAACATVSTTSDVVTITKSDLTGIQTGDYLVVAVGPNESVDTTSGPWFPNSWPSSLTGWHALYTPQYTSASNNTMPNIYGRFVEDADVSWSFKCDPSTPPASLCYRAIAYRNVSRRLPLDYMRNDVWSGQWTNRTYIRFPPSRQHGEYGNWALWTINANMGSNLLYVPDDTEVRTEEVTVLANASPFSNTNKAQHSLVERKAALTTNLLTGQVNYGEIDGHDGWSVSGVSIDRNSTSSNARWDTIRLTRDNTTKQYYIQRTVSLTEGTDYWLRFKHGVISTTYWLGVSVLDPSATHVCGFVVQGSGPFSFNNVGGAWTYPDHYGQEGHAVSGAPDYVCGDTWLKFTAASTGTYTIRFNVVRQSAPTVLSWNAGNSPTPSDSGVCLMGAVLTASYFPEYYPSGLTSDTYYDANYVPSVYYERSVTNSAGTPGGSLSYQLVDNSQSTFNQVKLIRQHEYTRTHQLATDALGQDVSLPQPGRYQSYDPANGDWNNAGQGTLLADRIVFPTYRLTEGGADVNGQYYWECSVAGLTDAGVYIGIVAAGAPETSLSTAGITTQWPLYAVRGSGATRAGASAGGSSGGSLNTVVLGFALDIPAGTLGIYRDGVLAVTLTMDDFHVDTITPWRACLLHTTAEASTNDAYTFDFNFVGPFTYAAPSGYVAYDFLNE